LGGLCGYFRTSEASFRATRNGYLVDDKARTESIRRALTASASGKKLCGISWRSTNAKTGSDRSLEIKAFVDMLRSDNLQFVSLQYGDTAEEIERAKAELGVTVLSYKDIDNFKDIDGLASLIQACDLVVSIDNTTVHLAGALGKDTRVLLPLVAEWRWLADRDDSPWYASVKLYRQVRDRDWAVPFEKLKADLSRL
jgi:ADP-heptose:LPS heptosyltransferase